MEAVEAGPLDPQCVESLGKCVGEVSDLERAFADKGAGVAVAGRVGRDRREVGAQRFDQRDVQGGVGGYMQTWYELVELQR